MNEEDVRRIVREELAAIALAGLRELEPALTEYVEGLDPLSDAIGGVVMSIVRGLVA